MFLLFILGIIMGLAVDSGWFWLSGVVALIVLAAELTSDW